MKCFPIWGNLLQVNKRNCSVNPDDAKLTNLFMNYTEIGLLT